MISATLFAARSDLLTKDCPAGHARGGRVLCGQGRIESEVRLVLNCMGAPTAGKSGRGKSRIRISVNPRAVQK